MAEQYQIQAVSGETRDFSSTYGTFRSYKLKLRGIQAPVELSQKIESPAPQEGDILTGDILPGKFGPKFKKEYNQGGFTGGGNRGLSSPSPISAPKSTGFSKGSVGRDDTYTMYLAYAKDIAVAMIDSKVGYDQEKYASIIEDVVAGGIVLYDERPGKKERNEAEVNEVVDKVKDFFAEPDFPQEKTFEPSEQDLKEARELFDK